MGSFLRVLIFSRSPIIRSAALDFFLWLRLEKTCRVTICGVDTHMTISENPSWHRWRMFCMVSVYHTNEQAITRLVPGLCTGVFVVRSRIGSRCRTVFWITAKPDWMHLKFMNLYPWSILWWSNWSCRSKATSSMSDFTLSLYSPNDLRCLKSSQKPSSVFQKARISQLF